MLRHGNPAPVAGAFQKSKTLQMMLGDSPGLDLSKKMTRYAHTLRIAAVFMRPVERTDDSVDVMSIRLSPRTRS